MMIVALGLVPIAGFFSAGVTALSRMTLPRALKLADEERRGARQLSELMQDPVRTLNLLALVELAAQVTAAVLLTAVVVPELSTAPGVAIAAVVATLVLFVFAEVAPKTLAVQRTDSVACAVAPFLGRLAWVTSPLVRALIGAGNIVAPGRGLASGPFVTEDELRDMIDVAGVDEVIEESERAMIHSIFELGDTVVREIMVPRPDMVMVSDEDDLSRVVDLTLEAGHSRLPVYAGDRDKIIGLIYAKDVLRRLHRTGSERGEWQDLLRNAVFVPELKRIDKLLADLQSQKVHMAIVVDEYGATAGLVTIEDILEEIVGEIEDEYDTEQPMIEPLGDGTGWRVDARMPVGDLGELLETELPDEEWDTVGGLLFGTLGHVPRPGEDVEVCGVRLVAEKVKGRRVAKVLVHPRAERDGLEVDGERAR
jgi:CBS domain containing-hemolysin-like protein